VQAGLNAIFVVMAFMILYYRLPGALAALALFVYVSVTLAVFKLWPVTITSAGMAAFVLSVGMAVDANILIFERMKEELRLGRSLVAAIDAGFSRAWTSIRDSNVATLIICVILYWFGDQFGASLVKGFALTLALGVFVSLFSAIVVTRTFLKALVGTTAMQHLWLFGTDVVTARARTLAAVPAASTRGQTGRTEP
jgi:preprotein translocase subunit SecD